MVAFRIFICLGVLAFALGVIGVHAQDADAPEKPAAKDSKGKAKPAGKPGKNNSKAAKAKKAKAKAAEPEKPSDMPEGTTSTDDAKPAYRSSAPAFAEAPMSKFDGQTPLPASLTSARPVYSDGVGVIDASVLRSVAGDLNEKDFVADVAFKFAKDEQSIFSIGFGTKPDAIVSRVHGPGHGGYATFGLPGKGEKTFGKWPTTGLAIFRMEKQGDSFSMALGSFERGEFTPTAIETLDDFRESTPFLRRPGASVFVEATGGKILGMRLIIGGKPAASLPERKAAAEVDFKRFPLQPLAGKQGIPNFLQAGDSVAAGEGGVQRGYLRTHAIGLHQRDFVADIQFRFAANEQSILLFGLGGAKPGGLGWDDAVYSRVHGPGHGGYATFSIPGQDEKQAGKFVTPGPHVMRMEKRGELFSFAVGDVQEGEFKPYFTKSLLNFKEVAPFLNRDNAFVSVQTGGAVVESMRVIVDGKPAETRSAAPRPSPQATAATTSNSAQPTIPTPPPRPTRPTPPKMSPPSSPSLPKPPNSKPDEPSAEKPEKSSLENVIGARARENLLPLTATTFPTFLAAQRDMSYVEPRGVSLEKRMFRTTRTDFASRDFTFDVVFRFREQESAIAVIGIGPGHLDHNGAVIHDCVCSRVHGPGHGGYGTFTVSRQAESELGKFVTAGPHLFRLQKKGKRLTLAICSGFDKTFEPSFEKTLVDLPAAAPYLNDKNSSLFFGAGGIVDAVRLVVEGEPIESRDIAVELPTHAIAGRPLQAKLPANANLRFSLEDGPNGATVAAGQLAWTPTDAQLGARHIRVGVARKTSDGTERLVIPRTIHVVSAADAKQAGGDPTKVDALYKLPLRTDKVQVTNGADGESLLLLDGTRVSRLTGDGLTIAQSWDLPVACERIAERPDYFVALSDAKKALLLIDKKTLAIRRAIMMDYFRRHDVALHPTKPWAYVSASVNKGGDLIDSFMIVDENTGDVQEPEGLVGTWLAFSRDGKSLYVGEKQYRFNSSFDSLASYDIREVMRPYTRNIKYEPGANGRGLVLSPDGKRVSYLTFTGYPLYSKNVAAWDTGDLEKRPVIYPCKENGASCFWIAFHPQAKLAAAPIETGGVVCFDRETGEPIPNAVDLAYPTLGEVTVDRLYFSPDGRNILLECIGAEGRFLRRAPLTRVPK